MGRWQHVTWLLFGSWLAWRRSVSFRAVPHAAAQLAPLTALAGSLAAHQDGGVTLLVHTTRGESHLCYEHLLLVPILTVTKAVG